MNLIPAQLEAAKHGLLVLPVTPPPEPQNNEDGYRLAWTTSVHGTGWMWIDVDVKIGPLSGYPEPPYQPGDRIPLAELSEGDWVFDGWTEGDASVAQFHTTDREHVLSVRCPRFVVDEKPEAKQWNAQLFPENQRRYLAIRDVAESLGAKTDSWLWLYRGKWEEA